MNDNPTNIMAAQGPAPPRGRLRGIAPLLVGLLAGSLLLTGGSAVHGPGTTDEPGVIEVEIDNRTDPCMGTVHLSGLDFQNGTIEMYIVLGGSAPDLPLDRRAFNATPEEEGDGFMATLEDFEMYEGWEHYFEVLSDPRGHALWSDTFDIREGDCGDPKDEVCFAIDLMATANGDGSITITAEGLEGEGKIRRTSIGDSAPHIATLTPEEPTFIDTDTEVGVTYHYSIFVEGEQCDRLQVTAIPVFPTLLAGGLASILGIGAYAMVRRRP